MKKGETKKAEETKKVQDLKKKRAEKATQLKTMLEQNAELFECIYA